MKPSFLQEPVEQTCPYIDSVIKFLKYIEEKYGESIVEVIYTIEKVRDANHLLRKWGNDIGYRYLNLLDDYKDLEEKLDNCNSRILELEDKKIKYQRSEYEKAK